MATRNFLTHATAPGNAGNKNWTQSLMIAPGEGKCMFQAATIQAQRHSKTVLMNIGQPAPYYPNVSNGPYTETKDNSGTVVVTNGGIRFQAQASPADNDDVSIVTTQIGALAQDKIWCFDVKLQTSDVANLGFNVGFVSSGSVEVSTANPTDGVWLLKSKTGTTWTLRVVENGNAAVDLALSNVMSNSTDMALSFCFYAGATAGSSGGYVTIDSSDPIPFSAAQCTALAAMLATSPPSFVAMIQHRLNGTAQKNSLWRFGYGEFDN